MQDGSAAPSPPLYGVFFAYHEAAHSRANLTYFVQHALERLHRTHYYLIVSHDSGGDDAQQLSAATRDPRWTRVFRRANRGLDFCAWAHAMQTLGDATMQRYERVFLLNGSVRGPFWPPAQRVGADDDDDDGARSWTRVFAALITDRVKLAGLSINCHVGPLYQTQYADCGGVVPHVQSMFMVTDQRGLAVARAARMFDPHWDALDKAATVGHKELGLSQAVLRAGYAIDCLLPEYRGVDYARADRDALRINGSGAPAYGDPWYSGTYFGRDVHPYETVFFKTNHGIAPALLEQLTAQQCAAQERFDWRYYVDAYADLRAAHIDTPLAAWRHWDAHGRAEGRRAHP